MEALKAGQRSEPIDRHIAITLLILITISILSNVLTKHLSDQFDLREYGLLTVVLEVIALWQMTFNFRLRAGLHYLLARSRSGEEDLPSPDRATGICLAFDLLAMLALVAMLFAAAPTVAGWYDVPEAAGHLRLLSVFLLLQPFQDVIETRFNANKRFGLGGMALLCRSVLPSAAALVGALMAGPNRDRLYAAVLGYGVGMAISYVGWALPSWRQVHFCPHLWRHRGLIRRMGTVAWPVWFGELVKGSHPSVLKLLAGYVVLADAGLLRIALVVMAPAFMIGFALRIVTLPLIAERRSQEHSDMADLLVRAHNFLLFPMAAVLWVAGPSFIRWYYSPEFHGAADYLPVLLLMLLGNSFTRVAGWVLVGAGSPLAYVYVTATVAVASLPGMAASALVWGSVDGAVWWMTIGWVAGSAMTLWLIRQKGMRLNWTRTFLEPAAWAVAIGAVVAMAQYGSAPVMSAAVLAGLLAPMLAVRRQLRTVRAVAA